MEGFGGELGEGCEEIEHAVEVLGIDVNGAEACGGKEGFALGFADNSALKLLDSFEPHGMNDAGANAHAFAAADLARLYVSELSVLGPPGDDPAG